MGFEPKGEFFIPFIENVTYEIVAVIDDFDFFPLKGKDKNGEYYAEKKRFEDLAVAAKKAQGDAFNLREWFALHRQECSIGVTVQRFFQCSTGNNLKVLDLILPQTAYKVSVEDKEEILTPEVHKQDNALVKALASGKPDEVLLLFVGGTISFTCTTNWYKFRKKDGTFSAQFKLRNWSITKKADTAK